MLADKSSKLNLVMAEIKSITDKYDHLKQVNNDNKKEINQLKEACTTEIKLFCNELDRILDNLERNTLMELDNWEQNEDKNVDQYVSTIEAALNVLRVDCKRLCPGIKSSSNIQA